jgi:hypothetical protein
MAILSFAFECYVKPLLIVGGADGDTLHECVPNRYGAAS